MNYGRPVNFFLPWHLTEYENILREIDPDITISYWDWSLQGGNPWESDFWKTGETGFGGNGTDKEGCAETGPFRKGEFYLSPSANSSCVKRNFHGTLPTAIKAQILIKKFANKYVEFNKHIEPQFHDIIHDSIGGSMSHRHSASAPEFFLHHGFLDKMWSDWQKLSPYEDETFWNDTTDAMPATRLHPRDASNLLRLPNGACVVYEDPNSEVYRKLKG